MTKRNRKLRRSSQGRPDRHISVRSVRREEPDIRKLAKAVIALAMAQAEADAQAQREIADPEAPVDQEQA